MFFLRRAITLFLCVLLSAQGSAFARHLGSSARHHGGASAPPAGLTQASAVATPAQRDPVAQSVATPCSSKTACLSAAQLALVGASLGVAPDAAPEATSAPAQRIATQSPQPPEHRPRPLAL